MNHKRVTSTLLVLGMLIWVVCVLATAQKYMGEMLTYILFSASFLALLISAFYKNNSYAYLFVSVFLWLGFWLKLTVHLLIGYDYVEPVGGFDWTGESWDQVLLVSTVACWGILLGRLFYLLKNRGKIRFEHDSKNVIPTWYPHARKALWLFVIILVLTIAFSNVILGIQQIGLMPRTILFWPMNALIAWMVSIGSAIAISTLVWWELSYNRQAWVPVFVLLIEASISTISILSRGVYIFHAVPQLIALYRIRGGFRYFSIFRLGVVVVVFFMLFVVSIVSVTTFRAYLYPHAGGFTTLDQERLTRLEVLNGGIKHIKILMSEGEDHTDEALGLLKEKAELEVFLKRKPSKDHITLNKLIALDKAIAQEKESIGQGVDSQSKVLLKFLQERKLLIRKLFKVEGKGELAAGVIKNPVVAIEKASPVMMSDAENEVKMRSREEASLKADSGELLSEWLYQLNGGWLEQVLKLSIDRWIGLEGVMAVVGYKERGDELFLDALLEKRTQNSVTRYQEVCQSKYLYTDNQTWQFASLPGAVAFLYFSGSILIVFIGMFLFSIIVQFAERAILYLTKNPLLCALLGSVLANWVAQFGTTPRQDLPYFLMIMASIAFIAVIQKKHSFLKGERGV